MSGFKNVEVPLLWVTCDRDFQDYIGLKGYTGELPMLAWTPESVPGQEEELSIEMGDRELAMGALLILSDTLDGNPPNQANVTPEALVKILEHFRDSYRFSNLEELVLWFAQFAGDKIDSLIREEMLEGGLKILPESSKIRADLILVAWQLAHEIESTEPLVSVLKHFAKIDLGELDDEARQTVCYYAMCTAALLEGKDETERIYSDFVVPYVFDSELLERLERIRRHSSAFTLKEMLLELD